MEQIFTERRDFHSKFKFIYLIPESSQYNNLIPNFNMSLCLTFDAFASWLELQQIKSFLFFVCPYLKNCLLTR